MAAALEKSFTITPTPLISWACAPLHLIFGDLRPVLARHHAEIAEDDEPLNIDWSTYEAASRSGRAIAVTARSGEKLIGYIVFTLSRNLRHKHLLEATSSGWYIEPEYRGHLGPEIITKAGEYLKAAGVHKTQFILNGPAAKLLERHGYKPKHEIWEKTNG